jgi:hypothetical protein
MEFSLPAWLGALCGMILAAAIYGPGIRIIERRLRIATPLTTAAERSAFEDRLSVMRRLILAFDVGVLAIVGYWIGDIVGGRTFAAAGG